jgi:hypothetical protein
MAISGCLLVIRPESIVVSKSLSLKAVWLLILGMTAGRESIPTPEDLSNASMKSMLIAH